MPMRAGSTKGWPRSQASPSSMSWSSVTPIRLYPFHADTAPLPLAVRLSQTHTSTPFWAMSWRNRCAVSPQAFLTRGACGPA